MLAWGLIPGFMKDADGGRKPINARSETVASSGMFRGAFASRRCLIPMDAFYEWRTTPNGKQPYAFARADGQPLVLAGIWEHWRAPDGEVRRTFAILTTAANASMRRIHDRMPVIIEADDRTVWLGERDGEARELLGPASEDTLRRWPVSRDVNSPRHDRPDLLDIVAVSDDPKDDAEAGPDPA